MVALWSAPIAYHLTPSLYMRKRVHKLDLGRHTRFDNSHVSESKLLRARSLLLALSIRVIEASQSTRHTVKSCDELTVVSDSVVTS